MRSFVSPGSLTCFVLTILTAQPIQAKAAANLTRVEPKETQELLANPGMGWQTFHRFADEDGNLAGLPSASAYFRFYWREVEPADGAIDFPRFDELLAHARRAGQKLAFRIMCTGSGEYMDVPGWLKEKGCRGIEFEYEGRNHWVPDFTDPVFTNAHFRLIRELGRRYDGHPDLDLLDIGSVGLWGEWHMSGTRDVTTGKEVQIPLEMRMRIIDEWCRAFPKTSKVILIGSDEGMARAPREGFGWRADCLGDMGGFSKNWNHMDNLYLQQLAKTEAQDAWKQAPVAFESCWDMRKWKDSNWDIRHIFDYALRCHVSYVNNKSAPIPEGTREEVERVIRQMGYRLVLRGLEHPAEAKVSGELPITLAWENVGVAPPYRDYRVACKFKKLGENFGEGFLVEGESIRAWLPGRRTVELRLKVPPSAEAGLHQLSIGVIDAATRKPAVRLAISGRDMEGWYPLSRITIRR